MQTPLTDIEAFLQEAITQLEPELAEPRPGAGRPQILPSLCLWSGLLVCVLRGMSSQLALWRLLSWEGLWSYPRFVVTDQAVYNRLEREGTAPLERLFAAISLLLRQRLAPLAALDLAPFAKMVVALDETTLDPIARLLPALRQFARGESALLPGKLSALFDIRHQQWLHIQHTPNPQQNEKVAARQMVATLPVGSLILADLGYFGFAWFDDLTRAGYFWVSRLRAKTSYTLLHTFYQDETTFDGIIWLGAYRADQAAYAVRLVCYHYQTVSYRYITNVLDPAHLSLYDIARLYARRWDIELAFKLIKRHLGLHLLWSAKIVVILQQIWAVLILSQILQALRLEIAGRAGVDPFEVSMHLLVEYAPRLAAQGQDPVAVLVERGREAGFIRPSTRTQIHAPLIPPEKIVPLPPDLVLVRKPRYAQRRC